MVLAEQLGDAIEAAVHGRDSVPEAGQAAAGGGERVGVLVDTEHGHGGVAIEQCLGVAAAAERGVEHRAGRHSGEHVDNLGHHDRLVLERLFARFTPASAHEPALASSALERSEKSSRYDSLHSSTRSTPPVTTTFDCEAEVGERAQALVDLDPALRSRR